MKQAAGRTRYLGPEFLEKLAEPCVHMSKERATETKLRSPSLN